MEEVLDLETDYYKLIKYDLTIDEEDEVIIKKYLTPIVFDGAACLQNCDVDVDVFNENPSELFYAPKYNFAIVEPRTEGSGKTDGCESGCWRIMGRDKLIKSKKTGRILGFKKILKFCNKTKPRECKRIWVMEEYRISHKWIWNQDQVLCKIQLMFETEVSFLLAKHFSHLHTTSAPYTLLPAYGYGDVNGYKDESGVFFLQTISDSGGNYWPSYVTNDVYRLDPMEIVDAEDKLFSGNGGCFFANRTKTCGRTDESYQGGSCWRIMERDRLIKSMAGKILGFKRVFRFCENKNQRYVWQGEDVKVTWTLEEYRLAKKAMRNKVLCVIKLHML